MHTNPILPKKLGKDSHVRIIAPSRSGAVLSSDAIEQATGRLEAAGLRVSFGKHWKETNEVYKAGSIEARLADLHEAFADKSVDGIFTAIGGFNANQLLERIDYQLIRDNPKVFCGFSDITTLCNAIFAKANLVTYYGPHFSSWSMQKGFEYSVAAVDKALRSDAAYTIEASETWSDDAWFLDQENRTFYPNDDGNTVIQPGKAEGTLVGGHCTTFLNLRNTEYWPPLNGSIVCLEQNIPTDVRTFDASLQSLTQHADFDGVLGILIGRFPKESGMNIDLLRQIIGSKPTLQRIPIISNINFGHTTPIAVLPIGGRCRVEALSSQAVITITNH